MSALDSILAAVRRVDTEALLDLRPSYPPVAIAIERGRATLVRLKPRRRQLPILDAFRIMDAPEPSSGATIFRPNLGALEETTRQAKELFTRSGTKPGRVSLVLPDNLAKVSIVTLPERPANRKLLREVLRFKLRRSVPFRLEDAVIASYPLPGPGPEVHLLVAVMMRSVIEHYEAALEGAGARPGLIELCTPSLFNLVRADMAKAAALGTDAALLNCTAPYFTLMIVRSDRVVFYRCKAYAGGEDEDQVARLNVMGREVASSLSYYADKLAGGGVGTMFVRAIDPEYAVVAEALTRIGVPDVRPIDPARVVAAPPGAIAPVDGQWLAPALGAAWGRTAA